MSVQAVPYFKVTCDRPGCDRDSGAQGATAAFPTQQQALDDWLRLGGSLDPQTDATLCNYCQPQMCLTCGIAPATGADEDGYPACPVHEAPATAELTPVEQADGHPDLLPPVAGPGEPETEFTDEQVRAMDRAYDSHCEAIGCPGHDLSGPGAPETAGAR